MRVKHIENLAPVLERLYRRYNRSDLIKPDPLQFVYRFTDRTDMELAGLLAAVLAYGRVQQIERDVSRLLGLMEPSPCQFLDGFGAAERRRLAPFKHRFTTGDDISDLVVLLREVLAEFGSIEQFFAHGYSEDDDNIIAALSKFCDSLLAMHAKGGKNSVSRGLSYLLSRPALGSPCKRLNLFLRWMVRDDDVDTGLWKTVDKAKLIVPVDVHMGRLCRILGLYQAKTVSLNAAVEITAGFAHICPADPVKYDFALSRIGIVENCAGRHRKGCELCELFELCLPQ